MATHNFAVCKNCAIEINSENITYNCGKKCKKCYNEDRRNRYNNDADYHLKALTYNIESAKKRRKEKAAERIQALEDERKCLEEKIGCENRICKTCNQIVLKTKFRTGRSKCRDCENTYHRSRHIQDAERRLHRLHTDPIFKFKQRVRKCISKYLTKSSKDRQTNEYLGCSSSQYYDWLKYNSDIYTFENHGKTWHIDHVIPLSHFNFDDKEEQLIAFNWANTMPLSIEENLSKGSNILISQITQHKEKLLKYASIHDLTLSIKYIELIDKNITKLMGCPSV
jgi:hypothetical protein